MNAFKDLVRKNLNISITDNIMEILKKYYLFLVDYNKKVNLTRITKCQEVYYKHFYDSLLAFKTITPKNGESLFDIGSGAGFPGAVLGIVFPNLNVILCESRKKKAQFLEELISYLNLTNIKIYHGRAEDYYKIYKKTFTYITARAVSSILNITKYAKSLMANDSTLILYKTTNYKEELLDLKIKSFIIKDIQKESLPHKMGDRVNIFLKIGGKNDKKQKEII